MGHYVLFKKTPTICDEVMSCTVSSTHYIIRYSRKSISNENKWYFETPVVGCENICEFYCLKSQVLLILLQFSLHY